MRRYLGLVSVSLILLSHGFCPFDSDGIIYKNMVVFFGFNLLWNLLCDMIDSLNVANKNNLKRPIYAQHVGRAIRTKVTDLSTVLDTTDEK